jgi:Predicted integral membrane protein
MGGTANLVAVKQAIGMSDDALALALLTDAVCYSMWVALLFSLAKLAPAFNRWTRARSSADMVVAPIRTTAPVTPDAVLLWLAMALGATVLSAWLATMLPASGMVSAMTWTIILATIAGLVVAHTPLARFPGANQLSSALLIFVVAVMASQSNFSGISTAPLYLLCGVCILAIHAALMLLAARLFHFDMYLCGISSLAHVGGVAACPILAATYSAALVPVAVLLALLGYILGTGFGLLMATVLSSMAPV